VDNRPRTQETRANTGRSPPYSRAVCVVVCVEVVSKPKVVPGFSRTGMVLKPSVMKWVA
jgi:hypothetical protein